MKSNERKTSGNNDVPENSRRTFLAGLTASAGSFALGGCDRIADNDTAMSVVSSAEKLSLAAQRLLLGADRLAPEFPESMLSQAFRANGSTDPQDKAYLAIKRDNFARWKLEVAGLVERPQSFTMAQLRAMEPRTQITRHDCVEGWSCIGKWKGVQLQRILDVVGVKPNAKFVVSRCMDTLYESSDLYYESIDLVDARHPQTILAYDMNDKPLTVPHGAPLRLRVERQLGYKMAKYLVRIELVESLADLGDGKGGYWEDRGYDWYAGI